MMSELLAVELKDGRCASTPQLSDNAVVMYIQLLESQPLIGPATRQIWFWRIRARRTFGCSTCHVHSTTRCRENVLMIDTPALPRIPQKGNGIFRDKL